MSLADRWRRWHQTRRSSRWAVKTSLFLALLVVVMYPKLWLLPQTIDRLRNLDELIDPTDARLEPLADAVRERVAPDAGVAATLEEVQRVVNERIPYMWDWDNWGVMLYLPTAGEALSRGREDCDGRAVVAASLLRRMGYEAWLVTDVLHMWVSTPAGDTMSPTGGAKTLRSARPGEEEPGTRMMLSVGVVKSFARGLSYGIGAFPLVRELILIAGICLLTMHPRSSVRRRVVGCVLFLPALFAIRAVGIRAAMDMSGAAVLVALAGGVLALAAWLTLAIKGPVAADEPARPLPE
ncbi:MAG: hypothetical protein D6744_13720 [Planctomycetota bacterium]|nr:MAG: hypothetical protein D6744_13720 [Planctomycetota bacterium]